MKCKNCEYRNPVTKSGVTDLTCNNPESDNYGDYVDEDLECEEGERDIDRN